MKCIVLCLYSCLPLLVVCEISDKLYGEGKQCSSKDECHKQRVYSLHRMPATTDQGVSSKLLFVQLLFRHGDRAPTTEYKTDPNPKSVWEEGTGTLSRLGRKQHYRLGKHLRKIYKDFASFSPTEVRVTSTEYQRTMMSAESHVAGLFAPPEKWQFVEGLNWQPIHVNYLPKGEDRYLLPNAACVRAQDESARSRQTPEYQRFHDEHKEAFRQMSLNSGEKDLDLDYAAAVFDTIKVEKKNNLKVPDWVKPLWDEMDNVTDYVYYWAFKSTLLRRLRTGPLIGKIIDNMHKKIAGELPDQKFQIFSSHDMTVAMAMTALDVFNMKQPPYCATVAFELHEMTDGTHSMRLLYYNSTEPENNIDDPYILTVPGCSEFCPLDYIDKFVSHIIPDDWERECQKEFLLK